CPSFESWTIGKRSKSSKTNDSSLTASIYRHAYSNIFGKESICRSVETGCDKVTKKLLSTAIEKMFLEKSGQHYIDPQTGEKRDYALNDGIFVVNDEKKNEFDESEDHIKRFYKNSHIGFYCKVDATDLNLLYVDSQTDPKE